MPLASSPTLNNQPAVHSYEPGHFLTTSLAGGVVSALRRSPCRARGVASFDCSARVHTGCRRLVALCRVEFSASPIRPFRPHLVNPSVTLTSSHGGLFRCGQRLPGNEQ